MVLNVAALTIVKAMGLAYPAPQLVAIRAAVGLAILSPWIGRERAAFAGLADARLHALRVALSAVALTGGFFAVARLPLALYTAIGFTRPVVMMAMAALILGEAIPRARWIAAAVALLGAGIAAGPVAGAWDPGLMAAVVVVFAGTGAIIVTRRLSAAPPVVLMALYTAGLTVVVGPWAALVWAPVAAAHWPALLMIGVLSQAAQLCFLSAHARADAAVLGVLGYLSLPLTAAVGVAVFDEVPGPRFALGAALIVGSAMAVTLARRR